MGQLVFGLLIGFVIFVLPVVLFFGGIVWSTEKPIRGYLLSVVGAVFSLTIWGKVFELDVFNYPKENILLATAIVCGAACVMTKIFQIRNKKKVYAPKPPVLALTPFSDKYNEYQEMFAKAATDFEYIASVIPNIKNEEISSLTEELQKIAKNIFLYLNQNQKRMPIAKEFVNYYQDRTAELLKQYSTLRGARGHSEALAKLEMDMITTFRGFVDAYNKQFDKVIDADIMDMDAEMKVARQVMLNDGVSCEARKIEVAKENDMSLNISDVSVKQNEPEKASDKGWNFKYVGVAAVGVVLGAFGVYKFFGKKQ